MIQGWFNGWLDCIVGRPMAMVLLAEVMQVKSQGALEHVVIVIVRIPTWHPSPSQFYHQHMSFIASTKCPGNMSITPILFRCSLSPIHSTALSHSPSPTSQSNAHHHRENLSPRQPPLKNGPLMVAAEVYGSRRTKQSRSHQRSAPRLQTAPDRLALGSCNDGLAV